MPIQLWTAERIQHLTDMWNAGHTISVIGKALGTSRNAISGKADRLGLPGRASPIIRDKPDKPRARKRRVQRSSDPTALALPSQSKPRQTQKTPQTTTKRKCAPMDRRREKILLPASEEPSERPPVTIPVLSRSGIHSCQFPLWGPNELSGTYCGEPCIERVSGEPSPYCLEHYRRCYVVSSSNQLHRQRAQEVGMIVV